MIGLDTNVLVRAIVGDDPEQAEAARRLLDTRCTEQRPGYINRVVLCEFAWVLRRAYRLPRDGVAEVIEGLLSAPELSVEDADAAWEALALYHESGCDFADALIGVLNRHRGCSGTASIDRDACVLSDFFAV